MQLRRWLQRSPYLANSVLAAAIMGVGDMAAQRVEHAQAQGPPQSPPRCAHGAEDGRWDAMPKAEKSRGKEGGETYSFRYSWPRAATMVSYSFLVFSPMTVFAYKRVFIAFAHQPVKGVGSFRWNCARAAVANIALSAPMNTLFFIYATTLQRALERFSEGWGGSRPTSEISEEIEGKIRQRLLPTVIKSGIFWIPVSSLNFQLVPADFRVVTVSLASLVWNTSLSLINAGKVDLQNVFWPAMSKGIDLV